jgi:predicted ABC-type ATPase
MSKYPIEGLPIDLDFSQGDPNDWRNLEDPDSELENDEDEEAPDYVKSMLGFDPAEFNIDDSNDTESDESDIESNESMITVLNSAPPCPVCNSLVEYAYVDGTQSCTNGHITINDGVTTLIPDTKLMGTHGPTPFKFDPPYGHCPICGAKGKLRERRKDGNDTCEKGCSYPSSLAVHSVSANTELVENYPGQPRDSHGRFGSGAKGSSAHKQYVEKATGKIVGKTTLEHARIGLESEGKGFKGEPANPSGHDTATQFKLPNGAYTPERKALHDSIVNETLKGKTPVDKPIGFIMGGGPASGKSRILETGLVKIPANTVHIDSDQVKAKLPEYQEGVKSKDPKAAAFVHEESSDVAKNIQKTASNKSFHTLLDGTGDSSPENLEKKIKVMRDAGQKVVGHYVTVDTETAVQRSNERAKKTGRYVPEAFIRETHANVSRIVPEAIKRGLFDEFHLWDTSTNPPSHVAIARGTELVVHDHKAWNKFLSKGID